MSMLTLLTRSSLWTPLSLPGLVGWWDNSDLSTLWQDSARTTPVTADGDPRGAIDDKSGNARHRVQATAGKRATYKTGIQNGLAVGRYDGVDDFDYVDGAFGAQPFTVLSALKTGNTNSTVQWDGKPGGAGKCVMSHGAAAVVDGQEISAGTPIGALHAAGAFHVYEATYAGAASSLLIDGATLFVGDAGTRVLGGFTMGSDADGAGASAMDEGETLIIIGASAAEKAAVRAYLKAKWGTP